MTPSIFAHLDRHGDRPCLVAGARRWTYRQAVADADAIYARKGLPEAGLAFVAAHTSADAILAYVGAVRRGYAVHLLDPARPETTARLIDRHRPDVIVDTAAPAPVRVGGDGQGVSPDIAILLSTSGSTGTPKLVKLSHAGMAANTGSIISYLGLGPDDVGITSLKPFYSYGMSVVNTHLVAGACLVVTDLGMDNPAFWDLARAEGVTNVAGVPFSYELLHRAGWDPGAVPSLRLLTQAGGRLDPEIVRAFAVAGARHGVGFCVMYGQTEAGPRMGWLPPELAATAPGSIGRAIPGGRFSLIDGEGRTITRPGVSGELVYEGPNVMVGYAGTRADLATTEHIARLRTGDLAHVDDRGLYHIDGRLARFVKPYGLRVSLDEVERLLAPDFPGVAVAGTDARIVVSLGGAPHADTAGITARLSSALGLPGSVFVVTGRAPAPRLPSGKVDYPALLANHGAPQPSLARVFLREFAGLLTGNLRRPASVLEAFRLVLGARVADDSVTFRQAGGDSLGYMQLHLLLEDVLGRLPPRWDEMTVADLEALREAQLA